MSPLTGMSLALVLASTPAPRGEVLDFSAKWCGPCQQVAPLVARLERDGLPIRSVDVDQHRDLAQRFNVTAMPTFVLVVDGKEVDRHVGMMGESDLRAWLNRIPSGTPTPQVAQTGATTGAAQGYVADPNVRLGTPKPLQVADAGRRNTPADFQVREEPQRTQPAQEQPRGGLLGLFGGRRSEPEVQAEIRASDAPLNEVAPKSTPMAASVRLRVTVDGRINLGSGTVVACDAGKALIVTCGHIFRGFSDDSVIEVNLFEGNTERSIGGRLVKFDAEADVGLVMVETDHPLPTAPVARDVQRAQAQESVLNIGCSGGQPPTAAEVIVTEVNPYIGADNLECTGVPVQGRSGGGLFRSSGELVGVCIAADPDRKRGVYAGLLAVHELLEQTGYASLFRTPDTATAVASEFPVSTPGDMLASNAPSAAPASGGSLLDALAPADDGSMRQPLSPRDGSVVSLDQSAPHPAPTATGTPIHLGPEADDAEIVCIIRSRSQPASASQVVIIHQASPKMLSYLRGEMGTPLDSATAGSLLSSESARRTREHSVPTMGVSPARPLPSRSVNPQSGELTTAHKPGLQPTALSAPIHPRRYVRTR